MFPPHTGIDRYYDNLRDMLGYEPSIWWRISWVFFCPVICVGVFFYSLYEYQPLTYGSYVYPWWGQLIGWFLALSSMLCIPGYFAWIWYVTPGTFDEKVKKLCRPDIPEIEAQIKERKEKELRMTTITPV